MADCIEKQIDLNATVSRVWRALSDHREFGAWFGVELEGPFVPGQETRGRITSKGYEHVVWKATVKEMRPEQLFSFTWYPYAVDPAKDYSAEEPTVVTFRLEPIATGTRLLLTECGFDRVPASRRDEAFRMDEKGWTSQMKNIERHVAAHP